MKKLWCLLFSIVLGVSVFALSGCKKPVPDTEETLEVFVLDAGYGSKWCEDMLALFKQQEWVKDKYPNLQTVFSHNDVTNFAESKLNAGERSNTIDLMFGTLLHDYAGPNGDLEDLTQSVYKSKVPGEGDVLWMDKAITSYNESNRYIDVTNLDGEPRYYVTSWAGGMNSILYNETILKSFGISVPNTTDELLALCAAISANKGQNNGKYNKGYSFIQSKDASYWRYLHDIWWAQYEGVDRYLDFWNGIDDNRYSVNIFSQAGKLETLKVYESLLSYDKGYLNASSFTYEFMQAQTLFLQGEAVFHVNGDWFDNEMSGIIEEIKQQQTMDTFKTMKMPVVSSLGTKLGISDDILSKLIDYVDGTIADAPEFTSTKGYTNEQVIDAVTEARTIVHSIGPNHTAVIPKYANGKDVAIDFLRFMATDIANESYIRSTGGASLPFNYDVKTKNPELYNKFSDFQKSRHDYFSSGRYEIYTLPSRTAFPLARYGGLNANVKDDYYNTFSANGNKKKPEDFIKETKDAWTQAKWEMALASAGIAV